MVVQLSLLPDERPDELVTTTARREIPLRRLLKRILRKETPYNFCMLVKETLSRDEDFIEEKYGVNKIYLEGLCEAVWGHFCYHQETIDSFLEKVRTDPHYRLNIKPPKDA